MSIPTIDQLEQKKREAHYAVSMKMAELNEEATRIQQRLQQIQAEAQQVQEDYRIEDAKLDAQIELLKALEEK